MTYTLDENYRELSLRTGTVNSCEIWGKCFIRRGPQFFSNFLF